MKKPATVAIAIGMAFAATPSAQADDPWIAMAISDSTGQIKTPLAKPANLTQSKR